jgi:rhamnogalacturonyl hydrolase YesR
MKNINKNFPIYLSLLFFTLFSACKSTQSLTGDSDENAMVNALVWQEANPIFAKAPTDWTNGAYYTGVTKAHESTNNPVFLKALKDMAERNEWNTWERFYHADDVAISYAYLYLDKIGSQNVNLEPTKTFVKDHFSKPHEWKDGTSQSKEKQILWWWCDALFMAPPVIVVLADKENDVMLLNKMHEYYMETYDLLFDKEESLFARDTRFQWTGADTDLKEENGKKIFWSRGNGWVLGGLALLLEDLPKDYQYRPFYENLFKTMSAKIKQVQHPDGLWRTSLLSPDSYNHGEVSGSGFYTFALAWGVNNGLLNKNEYKSAIDKAWKGLRSCQQANGKVGWVQNIGAEPKPATADSWQNYGTGAFLLAGSEVIKMK